MGIDYGALGPNAISKGPLRVETAREQRLSDERAERLCRAEVWRRYGRICNVPGCRLSAKHQHHIVYRSQSKALKFVPENRAPLCNSHHRLEHAGKITIHGRTQDGALIVTGEPQYLEFKA